MSENTAKFEFNMDQLVYLIKGLDTAVEYAVLNPEDTKDLRTRFNNEFKTLYNEHKKTQPEYVECRFGLYNDEGDPVYSGWYKPQEGRWNGWLQPYCDEETFKQIRKDIIPTKTANVSEEHMYSKENLGEEDEWLADFANQKPNKDGYYDVGHGICWMSEADD